MKAAARWRSLACLIAIVSLPAPAAAVEVVDIIAFGDSITQGYKRDFDSHCNPIEWGIMTWQNGTRQDRWGYEPKLEQLVSGSTRIEARVYNWGHGGEKTPDGVNRIKEVLKHSGEYVLILEGANDVLNGISHPTTAFNLGRMAQAALDAGRKPVMATITPITGRCRVPDRESQVENWYNPSIKSKAEELGVPLADQFYAMAYPKPIWWDENTSGDELHVSDKGDQRMAQEWLETLAAVDSRFRKPIVITPILELLLEE